MANIEQMAIERATGYTMDLYCKVCQSSTLRPRGPMQTVFADGPKAYHLAHNSARKYGWILHKDGFSTCPSCAKMKKSKINKKYGNNE